VRRNEDIMNRIYKCFPGGKFKVLTLSYDDGKVQDRRLVDIFNKSVGSIQLVIMIVYFITLFMLMDIDGIAMKVLSYLPFSSYSAMFARVAMGNVAVWEVVVSFIILVASIIGVGMIGSCIYRMGTLRYGNPIKITTAIKSLRKQKNK
jgi:ABC-type Na+ efflux pump permease subunit